MAAFGPHGPPGPAGRLHAQAFPDREVGRVPCTAVGTVTQGQQVPDRQMLHSRGVLPFSASGSWWWWRCSLRHRPARARFLHVYTRRPYT